MLCFMALLAARSYTSVLLRISAPLWITKPVVSPRLQCDGDIRLFQTDTAKRDVAACLWAW